MRTRHRLLWYVVALVLTTAHAARPVECVDGGTGPTPRPVEGWAAPGLKVTAGLELWLDAARQNAARRALGRPERKAGERIDVWYDASGHGRHLTQKDPQAQPTLILEGKHAAVRFD